MVRARDRPTSQPNFRNCYWFFGGFLFFSTWPSTQVWGCGDKRGPKGRHHHCHPGGGAGKFWPVTEPNVRSRPLAIHQQLALASYHARRIGCIIVHDLSHGPCVPVHLLHAGAGYGRLLSKTTPVIRCVSAPPLITTCGLCRYPYCAGGWLGSSNSTVSLGQLFVRSVLV